jgi:hypothetical protein
MHLLVTSFFHGANRPETSAYSPSGYLKVRSSYTEHGHRLYHTIRQSWNCIQSDSFQTYFRQSPTLPTCNLKYLSARIRRNEWVNRRKPAWLRWMTSSMTA